jgi:hypothetical protein
MITPPTSKHTILIGVRFTAQAYGAPGGSGDSSRGRHGGTDEKKERTSRG